MKRFTILNLMGVVVVLALGVAALRDADDLWAGGLLLATPFILCVNLVGGVCGQEGKRARRLGFATFGWAYLRSPSSDCPKVTWHCCRRRSCSCTFTGRLSARPR